MRQKYRLLTWVQPNYNQLLAAIGLLKIEKDDEN